MTPELQHSLAGLLDALTWIAFVAAFLLIWWWLMRD